MAIPQSSNQQSPIEWRKDRPPVEIPGGYVVSRRIGMSIGGLIAVLGTMVLERESKLTDPGDSGDTREENSQHVEACDGKNRPASREIHVATWTQR